MKVGKTDESFSSSVCLGGEERLRRCCAVRSGPIVLVCM